jgi:protein-S-isoprenylcysteine O-methyltransferase Ste14
VPNIDEWYRTVLLVIAVLTMIVAGYHRIQAHRAGGAVSRRGEGVWLFAAIRLCGLAMFVCLILTLTAPNWIAIAKIGLPAMVRWIGAAMGLGNVVFLGWTLHTLGRNLTDTVATRKEHTLVTGGPYRYVRHPFYLAMLIVVVGLSLLADNWLLLLFGIATFILLLIRAPIEERELEARFGEAYRNYRARTGAVFPKFW